MTTDLESVETALDALLAAMVAEDLKPRPAPGGLVWHVESVTAERLERAARMTRLDLDVADLAREPVRAACRQAVRRIGEYLFAALGSLGAMEEIAEGVAAKDSAHYGRRASIIDHAWDRIGSGAQRWWA